MKRLAGILLLAAACAPNYQSGVTQCSDSHQCPDGYYCATSSKCFKGTAPGVTSTGGDVVPTGGMGGSGGVFANRDAGGEGAIPITPDGSSVGRDSAVDGVSTGGNSDGATIPDLVQDLGTPPDLAQDATVVPEDARAASEADAATWQSNTTSVMGGTAVGSGTTPSSSLVRTLPVTLKGTSFDVKGAYLSRTTIGSAYSLVVIPVTYTGSTMACFVDASFQVLGASGSALTAVSHPLLTGSVGYGGATSTVYTDTCMQPGEIAFLLDYDDQQLNLYLNASSSTLTLTADSAAPYRLSGAVVQATAWSFSGGNEIISVKNIGTATANLSATDSTVILLDANYVPLYWDYLSTVAGSETLDSGAMGYLTDSGTIRTFGAGSALYQVVHVKFAGN